MKKIQACLLTFLLLAAIQEPAFAGGGKHGKTSTLASRSESISGTVESVDPGRRIVTVKRSDGGMLSLWVDERVKNFAEAKNGRKIAAKYLEPVAVAVEVSSAAPANKEIGQIALAPMGKTSKGMVAALVQNKGVIEKLDHKRHQLRLKADNGSVMVLKVDRSVKDLGSLKVGESVLVTHTTPLLYWWKMK